MANLTRDRKEAKSRFVRCYWISLQRTGTVLLWDWKPKKCIVAVSRARKLLNLLSWWWETEMFWMVISGWNFELIRGQSAWQETMDEVKSTWYVLCRNGRVEGQVVCTSDSGLTQEPANKAIQRRQPLKYGGSCEQRVLWSWEQQLSIISVSIDFCKTCYQKDKNHLYSLYVFRSH